MPDPDSKFMRLALREAVKGQGRTSPNPCVGAVVVKDGRVVGRGYHRQAGAPHAEPIALRDAGRLARGATLYVTLEPCNHQGRTPPCTEAILQSGIKKVVAGMIDPNPRVAGGGCGYLAGRGLQVFSGVLEEQCREINLPFIKHSSTGLPWVVMKAGMSLDGRIAPAADPVGSSVYITGQQSRLEVHRIRDRLDAVLIGINTALADDPLLTVRLPGGRGRDPLRVVLDTGLRLPPTAAMLKQKSTAATWIFCGPKAAKKRRKLLEATGAVIKTVSTGAAGGLDLKAVLAELGGAGVTSLLVEGGGKTHGSFLQAGLVNQVILFVAPKFLGAEGVPLVKCPTVDGSCREVRLQDIHTRRFGDDIMIEGKLV